MFVVRSPRASPEHRLERGRERNIPSSAHDARSFSNEQRPAAGVASKPVDSSANTRPRPAATNAPPAAHYSPPSPVVSTADIEVRFAESDILKVVLDYLQRQGYVRAMRALEKDSSLRCDPAHYPGTFRGALRESVLDGAWDSVARMLVPLVDELEPALRRSIEFQVERQRVVEMIARHKGDVVDEIQFAGGGNSEHAGGTAAAAAVSGLPGILDSLRRVKAVCPTHDEYAELCSLLELPSLRSSASCYRTWTPLEGRHNLFLRLSTLLAVPLDRLQASVRFAAADDDEEEDDNDVDDAFGVVCCMPSVCLISVRPFSTTCSFTALSGACAVVAATAAAAAVAVEIHTLQHLRQGLLCPPPHLPLASFIGSC